MWRVALRFLVLALALLLGSGAWLMATESGARVAIAYISGLVPNFKARHDGGTLLGPLHLRTVVVKSARLRVEADDLVIDWSLPCLLIGDVCIRDARIGQLTLGFAAPASTPPAGVKRTLPAIDLPLDIDVGNLVIDGLDIVRGERRTHYTGIQAALTWEDTRLHVDRLQVGMPGWGASAAGLVVTHGDWPVDARVRFAMPRSGDATFTLAGSATGSLADTHLVLDSGGLLAARIDGKLAPLQPGMPFTASLAARRFTLPPRGDDAKATYIDDLRLAGAGQMLGPFTLQGNAVLDTPWTPPLPATVSSSGTWRGLDVVEIRIDDPRLVARIRSDYRWLGGQHFKADVDVRRLDLALVNAALPSQLTGALRVDGSIAHGRTTVVIDVAPLAGTLRQWPVDIRGRLRWQDAHWRFENVDLRQGANRMRLAGTLGAQWNAQAELVLDDLYSLQPAFAGSATGRAQITGAPTDPAFAFTLLAPDLLLPAVTLPAPLARTVRLPAATWQVAGTATLRDVRLDDAHTVDARAEGTAYGITAAGSVRWGGPLQWDLQAVPDAFPLRSLLPELGGVVGGPLRTRGALGAALEALVVDTTLDGTLDGAPLHIDAALDHTPARTRVPRLTLAHAGNRLEARGALGRDELGLTLDASARSLADSFRGLRGAGQLAARIDGRRSAPDIALAATGSALGWQDVTLAAIGLEARVADGGHRPSHLALSIDGVQRDTDLVESLALAVDGTRDNHHADLVTRIAAGADRLGLHLAVDGRWQDDAGDAAERWHGTLRTGEIDIDRWRWQAAGEPGLALDGDALAVDAHCWTDDAARACLTKPARFGADGHVDAELFHLPLDRLLADLMPLDTVVDGRIGGTASARWQDGALTAIAADVRNEEPLRLAVAGDVDERDIGHIDTVSVEVRTTDTGATELAGLMTGRDIGTLSGLLAVGPATGDAQPRTLAGELRVADVRLALLEAFTYQLHDIGGTLEGGLALTGDTGRPAVSGSLDLRDGRVGFTRVPVSLVDIAVSSRFDGPDVRFSGAFRTPESTGRAQIDGRLLFGEHWRGQATVRGRDIVLASLPEYQFTTAPDLRLDADAGRIALTGNVAVPRGRIEPKSLPAQSVGRSRDVIVIREEKVVEERGIAIRQHVDVNFLLGDDVRFRAFGGDGHLTGGLRVRSRPELPLLVNGELHVKDGKYSSFGQSLVLKQADVIFNGPADAPLVDALAVREINDAAVREVGLRLTGSLRAPQTTLYSAPAMSDEEVLAWLTTGRPLSDGPINLRGDAAQAAMSLGVAQGSALLTAAGQEIGLQDVQLATAGQGDKAEVQVGTNLNERVFVGYNRRVFTGDESVMVRLQLTRRLMLEALSGLESALDIFYTFEF